MNTPLRLAAVFGDHMVLCRNKPVRIFGEAADGARVTASLNGQTATVTARQGRFELAFAPMAAGGPYALTVTDGQTTLRFADVLLGDVYLAGGQSNMEMELKNTDDSTRLTAEADHPQIRFCTYPKQPWLDAQTLELERQVTRWQVLSPGECGDISAVAYHFAVDLQPELGVPVGVIGCYWGGTSVTCWLDEPALRLTTAGTDLLTGFLTRTATQTDEQYEAIMRAYDAQNAAWGPRVETLRAEKPDITWPELLERAGPCPWPPPEGRKSGYRPAGLAETMLKRIAPYTLTGVLYYQGEEDTKHPTLYRPLMMTLICFWRALFRDETLPFLYAQLPMFLNRGEADDRQWAVLREAQEQACQSIRHAALAVLIDCGEYDNIHPTDKRTVGRRFAQLARKAVYGKAVDAESPRALYALPGGNTLTVKLTAPVREQPTPALFELAGADGVYRPAQAALRGDTIVLTAAGVQEPISVRYAWCNYGRVNVFGENGLPLAPFRLGEADAVARG